MLALCDPRGKVFDQEVNGCYSIKHHAKFSLARHDPGGRKVDRLANVLGQNVMRLLGWLDI
jgi:hypothetical protein